MLHLGIWSNDGDVLWFDQIATIQNYSSGYSSGVDRKRLFHGAPNTKHIVFGWQRPHPTCDVRTFAFHVLLCICMFVQMVARAHHLMATFRMGVESIKVVSPVLNSSNSGGSKQSHQVGRAHFPGDNQPSTGFIGFVLLLQVLTPNCSQSTWDLLHIFTVYILYLWLCIYISSIEHMYHQNECRSTVSIPTVHTYTGTFL